MKITFVLPFADLSGGVRVVALYATALMERGHQVRVISQPAPTPSFKDRLRAAIRRSPVPQWVGSQLFTPLGGKHRILERRRAVTAQDLEDADFVVATWWETAEWVARLPASKGQKVYLLQDYEMFPYLPQDRVAATFHVGMRMVAVSDYIRDTIAEKHGIGGIDIVLNGVDVKQFDAPPRGRNSCFRVGFLLQKSPRKNAALALEVLRLARSRIPGLEMIAFGSSPETDYQDLPEGMQYEHAPAQSRIPGIYASCDAWLLTSLHEGFGLPILEAMACRTPVLTTAAGAAQDIVRDGENGWVLPFEAEAFVEKLLLLWQMPEAEWRQMSDHAHRTAQARQWGAQVDRFESMLDGWRHTAPAPAAGPAPTRPEHQPLALS